MHDPNQSEGDGHGENGKAAEDLAVIDADRFEAALHQPEVVAFLRQAMAEDRRLEREGLIHP